MPSIILVINGTTGDDRILLSQKDVADSQTGQKELLVEYNTHAGGHQIPVHWRDPLTGEALVEKFFIAGFGGDDTLGFSVDQNLIPTFSEFAPGPGAELLDLSTLTNIPGLSDRLFIGDFDGGDGDDTLLGGSWRDRLVGGPGANDELFGFAGNDMLFGDLGDGFATNHDRMFAGQGNDDLIGGVGTNELFAWSLPPQEDFDQDGIQQFGIFVDPQTGTLHDDDGDDDNNDILDEDEDGTNDPLPEDRRGPYPLENTGLNRLVGMEYDDDLYGGTLLDFMYGAGGSNTLYRSDGTTFDALEGEDESDAWKEYAKETGQVWYVGGTNADDQINVDFVTEPGLLADHHLITRLTDNNGNQSFAAQVRLDFSATDADGQPLWNTADEFLNLHAALEISDMDATPGDLDDVNMETRPLVGGLLPPEGEFLAIIVDALAGDDEVIVGPTVTKSVWVDAGEGDDRVEIRSGNPILSDLAESAIPEGGMRGRNDSPAQAFRIHSADQPGGATYTNLTIDSPDDHDWFIFSLADAANATLEILTTSPADQLTANIYPLSRLDDDSVAAELTSTGMQSILESLAALDDGTDPQPTDYLLEVRTDRTPTRYDLQLKVNGNGGTLTDMSPRAAFERRDIILGGEGNDILLGRAGRRPCVRWTGERRAQRRSR